MKNSQLFACFNKKVALYKKQKMKICDKYDITPTSFDIILFLHNNPEVRTAREICSLRGVKPAIVSVDIDKLIKWGYITRTIDKNDRRCFFISLTDKVKNITEEGILMQQNFSDMLFAGVDPDETRVYLNVLEKMLTNVNKCEKEGLDFGE